MSFCSFKSTTNHPLSDCGRRIPLWISTEPGFLNHNPEIRWVLREAGCWLTTKAGKRPGAPTLGHLPLSKNLNRHSSPLQQEDARILLPGSLTPSSSTIPSVLSSTSTSILLLGTGMWSFGHLKRRIKGKDYERKQWNNRNEILWPIPPTYLENAV